MTPKRIEDLERVVCVHSLLLDTMATGEVPSSTFRLPEDIVPIHYDLDIVTDLEPGNFSFHGEARIKIKCLKSTDTIKIHARDLTFTDDEVSVVTLKRPDETNDTPSSLEVAGFSTDIENEFYIIKTSKPLTNETEYSIFLPFEGLLEENLIGYYRSSYFDQSSNSTKWLAVTHFEPSDARQAFPCFDEPGLKATFTIRLAHEELFKGVSNMPLKSTVPFEGKSGWVWDEFETTVPMSTYLVAYMVSEFEFKQSDPQPNNVTFRVWARRDAIDQARFPSTVGPRFLAFYEEFFDVKYPLPKQDMLAIPDFKIAAMENWGLITFRESALLLDEHVTSSPAKLQVASVMAHELAHMWFGNLVTMWWWTDLWLKEGFATYMAGLAVHHVFPEWNSLDGEALSDLLRVFHLDSLKSSHPVSVPIGHSREISQIFDAISYDKGSFLLRMMSLFLGEKVFRAGVTRYLNEHKYNNAEQDNLWASFTEEAHRHAGLSAELTVKQIMDTWTLQTGYPLITVERDYDTGNVTVSQKRYLATESENPSDYEGSWWVPLSYSTAQEPYFNRTQPEQWLPQGKESMVIVDVNADQDDWIVFNNRAAGLYKVNYDSYNWELLVNVLNSEFFHDIDVMNRALLIVDSMDLANCGKLDYKIALDVINYVTKDTAFVPWSAALNKLAPIKTRLSRTRNYGMFKAFVRKLMTPVVENLGDMGKEPDSFEEARLMNIVTQWGCPLDIGRCRVEASTLFEEWRQSDYPDLINPIPKDVRRAVYAHAAETGGGEAWEFLWERYRHANVVAEKNNILLALTNAKEVWLHDRYLEKSLDEQSGVRKQDSFIMFKATASHDVGFYVAQKFFIRRIKDISTYFGAKSNLIGHYFSAVAEQLIYKNEYEELKEFSEKYKDLLAPASLAVKQALEAAQLNIKWMEEHYAAVSMNMHRLNSSPPARLTRKTGRPGSLIL